VLSLSLLLSALVAAHAASYTFTTIDDPGATNTWAYGINDTGQIVGTFGNSPAAHGFVTDGATFTTIDVPGATRTYATGINNYGQIVGYFDDATGTHGFVTNGATFTTIDVHGATTTWAYGINDVGQIVGTFHDATGVSDLTGHVHGFLKDGDTFTIIDVPGAPTTQAYGINMAGQIVGGFQDATGVHGFLKTGATFTTIAVPGSTNTWAYGINAAGQIVGQFDDYAEYPAYPHGFLKDGTMFTTIDVPGARNTYLQEINVVGQLVGGAFYDTRAGAHGFLATPTEVDKTPPLITVSASPATLWPANGKRVAVTVSGTITDESGVQSAAYQVIDEYGQIHPSGTLTLGAGGSCAFTIALEASRRGNDPDGRRYTIAVSATDNLGNSGLKWATVTVPHG
jgi:probable HAF family extracellular repeat protein